ncbi:MAG: hypothetical protein RI580_07445 [Halothece sp. Uz-M2-17]|nr:hypothetical protein [Halothece sp. Uz-M2-17]
MIQLGWGAGAQWTIGYILVAITLFYAQWQKRPSPADEEKEEAQADQ